MNIQTSFPLLQQQMQQQQQQPMNQQQLLYQQYQQQLLQQQAQAMGITVQQLQQLQQLQALQALQTHQSQFMLPQQTQREFQPYPMQSQQQQQPSALQQYQQQIPHLSQQSLMQTSMPGMNGASAMLPSSSSSSNSFQNPYFAQMGGYNPSLSSTTSSTSSNPDLSSISNPSSSASSSTTSTANHSIPSFAALGNQSFMNGMGQSTNGFGQPQSLGVQQTQQQQLPFQTQQQPFSAVNPQLQSLLMQQSNGTPAGTPVSSEIIPAFANSFSMDSESDENGESKLSSFAALGGSMALDDMGLSTKSTKKPKQFYNSTSSIYVSSTMRVPNNSEILTSVGSVLNCILMQTADQSGIVPPISDKFKEFDERYWAKLHINSKLTAAQAGIPVNQQEMAAMQAAIDAPAPIPSAEEIYKYIAAIFELAQFSPECSTISLVLVNRFISFTKMQLHQRTWRLLLLSSLMIAQKIWDDRSLANVDFPIIWKHACPFAKQDISVEAFNTMESRFLTLLSFNVFVSSALYAKYYFELRTLHDPSVLRTPEMIKPLSKLDAERLEARSAMKASEFEKVKERKTKTDNDLGHGTQARAVLS